MPDVASLADPLSAEWASAVPVALEPPLTDLPAPSAPVDCPAWGDASALPDPAPLAVPLADPVALADPPLADLCAPVALVPEGRLSEAEADLPREVRVAADLAAGACLEAALVSCVENSSVLELFALAPDLELDELVLLDD